MANKRISNLPAETDPASDDVLAIDGATTRKTTRADFLKENLEAIRGLTSEADKGIQFTGSGTAATYDLTAAGKALLDDADAGAQRATLGLVIGTDVQAYDADLDSWSGKTAPSGTAVGTTDAQTLTNKTFDIGDNSVTGTTAEFNAALTDGDFATLAGTETLTNKTLTSPAITSPTGIVKGDVGLGNVDNTSDTTKWAASATLTNKAFDTAGTGNSFKINGTVISDKTGTGKVVLDNAPTLTDPIVGTQSPGDNSTKAASTAFVTAAISGSGGGDMLKSVYDPNGVELNIFDSSLVGPNDWFNGNCDIFQLGPSMAAPASIAGYQCDFFGHRGIGSTVFVEQKALPLGQTDIPGGVRNYVRCTVASAFSTDNIAVMAADIDRVSRYAGSRCTLSFWAKADGNKDVCLERDQYFGSGGSPSSPVWGGDPVTISLTTEWQRFDLSLEWPSVAGKTIGTSATDTDRIGIVFWLDAGSGWDARTNSLGSQDIVFDITHISIRHDPHQLVQYLEDPFGPYSEEYELQRCLTLRQVFTTQSLIWSGYAENGKNRWLPLSFRPPLRRVPVCTFSGVSALGFGTTLVASAGDVNGVQVTNTATSTLNTAWFTGNMVADANHPYTP